MKKEILLGIVILLSVSIVSASITVIIDVKNTFSTGETVEFNYKIMSDEVTEIRYTEDLECPEAPRQLLLTRTKNIGPDSPIEDTFTYLEVNENFEPQTCKALILVHSPEQRTFEQEFYIDALPSIIFDVSTCKDSLCKTESKIFLQNENIYFSYVSNVDNPILSASLTYPDKTTKQISIPGTITASQVGTYTIKATASKQGYKTVTETMQFGVIEKNAEIKEMPPTPEITASQTPETPSDQQEGVVVPEEEKPTAVLITLIALAILIVMIVYFLLKKKR